MFYHPCFQPAATLPALRQLFNLVNWTSGLQVRIYYLVFSYKRLRAVNKNVEVGFTYGKAAANVSLLKQQQKSSSLQNKDEVLLLQTFDPQKTQDSTAVGWQM